MWNVRAPSPQRRRADDQGVTRPGALVHRLLVRGCVNRQSRLGFAAPAPEPPPPLLSISPVRTSARPLTPPDHRRGWGALALLGCLRRMGTGGTTGTTGAGGAGGLAGLAGPAGTTHRRSPGGPSRRSDAGHHAGGHRGLGADVGVHVAPLQGTGVVLGIQGHGTVRPSNDGAVPGGDEGSGTGAAVSSPESPQPARASPAMPAPAQPSSRRRVTTGGGRSLSSGRRWACP